MTQGREVQQWTKQTQIPAHRELAFSNTCKLNVICNNLGIKTKFYNTCKVQCGGILFEKYHKVTVTYRATTVHERSVPDADDS